MIKELYEVLKALTEGERAGYKFDTLCKHCGADCSASPAFEMYEFPHTPDCPITKGRELVKQLEAMTPPPPRDPGGNDTYKKPKTPRGTKTIITGS